MKYIRLIPKVVAAARAMAQELAELSTAVAQIPAASQPGTVLASTPAPAAPVPRPQNQLTHLAAARKAREDWLKAIKGDGEREALLGQFGHAPADSAMESVREERLETFRGDPYGRPVQTTGE